MLYYNLLQQNTLFFIFIMQKEYNIYSALPF